MRTVPTKRTWYHLRRTVGMKPLSERDENESPTCVPYPYSICVGMKPLSERDENNTETYETPCESNVVGMKPLSERDENQHYNSKCRILF